MFLFVISFGFGVIFFNFLKNFSPFYIVFLLLMFSVIGLIWAIWETSPKSFWVKIFTICLAFAIGIFWTWVYVRPLVSWHLAKQDENRPIIIKGNIASLPKYYGPMIRFIFTTNYINQFPQKIKIQLNWYKNYPNLKVGDYWQLLVKLKRPHGLLNPGGFDFEGYLFAESISATGAVINSKINNCLRSSWRDYPLDRLRQHVGEIIAKNLANNQFSGVLSAIATGSYNGIDEKEWQVFRNTGTAHLVAIAGLHIGFVTGFIYFLLSFLWRRIGNLPLTLPTPYAAGIGALISAIIYSALAGFALPTKRAVIMFAVCIIALLSKRNIRPWSAFLIALLIIIILDPLVLLTSGFWLSFSAVASLIYVCTGRIKTKNICDHYWKTPFIVTIGLLPFCIVWFQQFSLTSVFANIVVVPIFGFIILPLTLLGSYLLLMSHFGVYPLILATKIMIPLWSYLEWLSSKQWAMWVHSVTNYWIIFAASLGIAILLMPRGLPNRLIGFIWLLPLIFYKPEGPIGNQVWFTLLDVGQGLSVVVRTANHILVYDTGPKFINNDAGSEVVVPFLRFFGINKVDTLVISHGDMDHRGGAESILTTMHVQKVITSAPEYFGKYNAENCWAGTEWKWDEITFKFLSPSSNDDSLDKNNNSCVLHISNGRNSVLLVGDIEAKAEELLVKNNQIDLASTILVTPHHGSDTSSTLSFVNSVNARYVLFPVGYLNRFHFPSDKVSARYQKTGAILLNSAYSGAITIKFDDKKPISSLQEYRKQVKNYWRN